MLAKRPTWPVGRREQRGEIDGPMTQRSGSGGRKRKGGNEEEEQRPEEELARETGEPLPDRAALSTLDADVAIPVNPALAADVLAGSTEETGEELDEPPESEDTAGEDEPDS